MKTIKNIPCTFSKPYENGHFASLKECKLKDINKDVANSITSRYKNGIGANSDNCVLVKEIEL